MLISQEIEILSGQTLAVFLKVLYKFGEPMKKAKDPTGRWKERILLNAREKNKFPETALVIVKTAEDLASLLDALAKIVGKLKAEKEERGMELKGRKLVTIRGGLEHTVYPGTRLERSIRHSMDALSHGMALAGCWRSNRPPASLGLTSGYPYLFSLENPHGQRLDIITVGRVLASWDSTENGSHIRSAPQSAQMKIYAPGNGLVRIPDSPVPANVEGDFISVGISPGMVTYLLSLPDLGVSLISQANLAAVLIWFLQNRLSATRFVGGER